MLQRDEDRQAAPRPDDFEQFRDVLEPAALPAKLAWHIHPQQPRLRQHADIFDRHARRLIRLLRPRPKHRLGDPPGLDQPIRLVCGVFVRHGRILIKLFHT